MIIVRIATYVKKVEKAENENSNTVNSNTVEPTNPTTVEPTPEIPQVNPNTKTKYTFYEYTLTPSEQVGKYSDWSNWSKDIIEKSLMVDVEVKDETETKTVGCTEIKEETYISGYNTETYIAGYVTKNIRLVLKSSSWYKTGKEKR